MTIVFWLLVATMILVALLIVVPPILRSNTVNLVDDLDQRNLGIARDRLAELKANLASGGISQNQYDEQVAELELALSDDLDLTPTHPEVTTTVNKGRWLSYLLLVLVPGLSLGLYSVLGNHQAINYVPEANPTAESTAEPELPSPEAINQMVAKLAEKMQKDPKNLEGWVMLGRSYKILRRYPEAVRAYEQALRLSENDPEIMLSYAEIISLENNNDWSGKPKELVMQVLAKDPRNTAGLWLAAMAFAQQGDKKTAIQYLRKLEAILPADSPDKQQIQNVIANSENETDKPAVTESPVQPGKPENMSVVVQVSLADELKSVVRPDDTVFIYAQALSGAKMPLAIVRKQVKDLPLSISLSDADAMMPNMKLSNFKQIRLLARVAKSGAAMPQVGDLVGSIEQVNVGAKGGHAIVINDRIK